MLPLCREYAARGLDGHITTFNYQLFTRIYSPTKSKHSDNERVSQRFGCSVCKNGTLAAPL